MYHMYVYNIHYILYFHTKTQPYVLTIQYVNLLKESDFTYMKQIDTYMCQYHVKIFTIFNIITKTPVMCILYNHS